MIKGRQIGRINIGLLSTAYRCILCVKCVERTMGARLFCGLSNLAAKCTRIGVGGQIPSHLSKPNRCPNQLRTRAELTESGTPITMLPNMRSLKY